MVGPISATCLHSWRRPLKVFDDELCLDVIYLDLAKAFNKVPHKRLSHKLVSHGIEVKY